MLIILIWVNCLERKPVMAQQTEIFMTKNEGENQIKYERAQRVSNSMKTEF